MRVNAPPGTQAGVSSAVMVTDSLISADTETGRPRVDSVEPNVGSLLGGTLLTIRGANLMPSQPPGKAVNISEPLSPLVSVNIGQRDGPRCAVDPLLSSATALICLVPPAASGAHARMIRRGTVVNQGTCGTASNEVYVKILNEGGAVSDPTWNNGLCAKTEHANTCTFRQTLGTCLLYTSPSPRD